MRHNPDSATRAAERGRLRGHWRDHGPVQHADHVALIRDGVRGAGPRWLELGAGDGEFTLALADLLGEGGEILALDLDRWALSDLAARLASRCPGTAVTTVASDFTRWLPDGPFDGVLAANSLHFVRDPVPVLRDVFNRVVPGGRLVVVEYDSARGNPYVPHPIPLSRWPEVAAAAGFRQPRFLHRVPSRFLGSIYAAAAQRPRGDGVP
jgi:ubiquinone/menaquinone biosynthesis C-methylase UbiE